jgi:hypothetical protein
VMADTVAGLGGVVERARLDGSEEMGRWGQMNCREVNVSKEGNWVTRFMVKDVVGVGVGRYDRRHVALT